MTYGKRPPLDEQKSLWESTVAREGVTTVAGEGTGLSLVDAGLALAGVGSFVSMMAVIYPGQPRLVDSRDITGFDNPTGEITVATAFKGGQVPIGVPYKIVTFRFVPAEVAALVALVTALMVDVGDPTGETLPSLATKWGDIARSLDLILGARWDAAGDLGTDIAAIIAGIGALAGIDVYIEQIPDTDVNETITDTEADCVLVNLPYIAGKTYCLRYLRLKCADPGVGRTVTVKLYERWNDAIAQLIDSFDIDSGNYGTYHSLMDIFSVPEIHSDAVLIRAVHDGTSPGDDVAVEVTYRYAVATA